MGRPGGGGCEGGEEKETVTERRPLDPGKIKRLLDLKVILNHSERKLYHFYVVYCLVAAPVALDCFKTLAAQVVARLVDV